MDDNLACRESRAVLDIGAGIIVVVVVVVGALGGGRATLACPAW
jgi:hypothetical protein